MKKYDIKEESLDDLIANEPAVGYNYAQYLQWTFEERVELIKGKIFKMSPSPSRRHQRVSMELSIAFGNFLKKKKYEVYHAPFDVRLPKRTNDPDSKVATVVQPDICVICNEHILDEKGCSGAPDLIIEILSPSTAKKDLTIKHDLYEENGVREYWIVYPNDQIVDVHWLEDGKYDVPKKYVKEDCIPVRVLEGLEVDLNDVFTAET